MSYMENKIINAFIITLIAILIIMVMLFYFNYQPYVMVYGEIKNEYVSVLLTEDEIVKLNKKLKYKERIIDYEIIEVGKEYIIHDNKLKKEIKLDFDYEKSEYLLELYLGIGEETNIWTYLYQKYMKGVIWWKLILAN